MQRQFICHYILVWISFSSPIQLLISVMNIVDKGKLCPLAFLKLRFTIRKIPEILVFIIVVTFLQTLAKINLGLFFNCVFNM